MSVEFTLHDNRLQLRQWNELLAAWEQKRADELYEPAQFSDGKPPVALIWGRGSTRGFLLAYDPKGTVGRFNALASRTDWVRGFHVMRSAVRDGGGFWERETGEIYGLDQLVPEQAREEATKDFVFSAKALPENASIPFRHFDLSVPRAQLRGKLDDVEAALAARLEKYATAYASGTMVLQGGGRVTTWALIPTIIQDADVVAVDWKDGLHVPLPKLKAILGARAEPLGDEATFLPELDPKRDAAILAALEKANIEFP